METTAFSSDFRYCSVCRKPLPPSYEDSTCSVCKEQLLFRDVKDFIRSHDVNEYDVAEHFNLPLQQVKGWIREGRIQYKDKELSLKYIKMHCFVCGEQIQFGTLCPKCMRQKNVSGQSAAPVISNTPGNMRHLTDSK